MKTFISIFFIALCLNVSIVAAKGQVTHPSRSVQNIAEDCCCYKVIWIQS